MRACCKYLFLLVLYLLVCTSTLAQNGFRFSGKVIDDKSHSPIEGAYIRILNSGFQSISNKKGEFSISISHKKHISVLIKHLSYHTKTYEFNIQDSLTALDVVIKLNLKQISLDSITVKPNYKPDTLVYSGRFGIYDYDFYEDKFILLTSEKNLDKAELKLADYNNKIYHSLKVPSEAGFAKELLRDYMGFTNLICEFRIYRIVVDNSTLILFPIQFQDFNAFIKPIIDTLNNKFIYSDYWKEYPQFNYYRYDEENKQKNKLTTIVDTDLLKLYNMEYYYMKPRERLDAIAIAEAYNLDEKIVAALMTGFTKSLYYDPLYAPLFILNDTIHVFDHYKNLLIHFDKYGNKLDSVKINYNHPKNWREWKRLMIKDDVENRVFAVFAKNGHKYLKEIDNRSGEIKGKYKLIFHSADKIKARDGYVYYVYRPFESTQEKFLYREKVSLTSKD